MDIMLRRPPPHLPYGYYYAEETPPHPTLFAIARFIKTCGLTEPVVETGSQFIWK
jgi:hypothetical protein